MKLMPSSTADLKLVKLFLLTEIMSNQEFDSVCSSIKPIVVYLFIYHYIIIYLYIIILFFIKDII